MLASMLKLKWLTMSSRIRHKRNRLLLLSFAGFFFLPLYVFLDVLPLFQSWISSDQFGIKAIVQLAVTLLSGIFFMLFFTGIPSALHYLYLSEDNDLFASLPISKTKILIFNILQIVLHNIGLYTAFALPVLIALVIAIGIHPVSVFALFISFVFIVIPSSLSSIFAGVMAKFFPVKNSRFFSSALMALAFLLFWGIYQFVRFTQFNPNTAEFSWRSMNSLSAFNDRFDAAANPAVWLCRMLSEASQKHLSSALLWSMILIAVSVLFLFIAVLFLYRVKTSTKIYASARKRQLIISSSQISVLLKHEFKSKGRDPRLFQTTAMLNVIMIIFSFSNSVTLESNYPQSIYMHIAILAIIGVSMQARTSIAFDGLFFQYRMFTPLPLQRLVWAKIIHAVLLLLPGVLVSTIIMSQKNNYTISHALAAFSIISLLLFGVAAVNLFLSTFQLNLNWKDFRELVGTNSRYMNVFISMIWGAVAGALLLFGEKQVIAFIIYLLYVCLCIFFANHATVSRLKKIQWKY